MVEGEDFLEVKVKVDMLVEIWFIIFITTERSCPVTNIINHVFFSSSVFQLFIVESITGNPILFSPIGSF